MCLTCGCGDPGRVRLEGRPLEATADPAGEHEHVLPDGTRVRHAHAQPEPGHAHDHGQGHDHDAPPAEGAYTHSHAAYSSGAPTELVALEASLLEKNRRLAERNRALFARRGVAALNLMSSPGSGKTSLLVRTLGELAGEIPMTVIEGDQETPLDAERIRATGAKAVQINTGAGCHLEADMVERAFDRLDPPRGSALFIENVGNLVCPALFDLGERARVVLLSTTEGDDKPLKYPHMFRSAGLVLVTKMDLAPHVAFDPARAERHARSINPTVRCLRLSALTGEGMGAWYDWLRALVRLETFA